MGDFYIVVREAGGSRSVIERDLVYSERSYKVESLPYSDTKYELCVLARDSEGNVKHFRSSQCQILWRNPSNAATSTYLSLALLAITSVVIL